jgi:hypothetical protein
MVWQKYLTIWQHICERNHWCGEFVFERPSSETQSISVAMKRWSVEHRAFSMETYFKNNDSVFMAQRFFRRHFNIHRNNSVPSCNTTLLWVRNLRETASATKRNPPGREPSLRTPENIKRVRQAFVRIPRQSASRNAIALRMSDHTVRRILHEDLNFHPYKMVMVQAINDQDTVNQKTVCEVLLNFQKRLPECVENKGHHLTDTIFKKRILQLKCFQIKIILVINSCKKIMHFSFYLNLKIVRFFCRTL